MNLPYIYELLAAADEQRHGILKLRGIQADHEVRLMVQAGLVEASFEDGADGTFTSINSLSLAGQTFLRAFKDHPIPDETSITETFSASQAVLVAKWKSNFETGLPAFKAA